jgi:hypothetical protein
MASATVIEVSAPLFVPASARFIQVPAVGFVEVSTPDPDAVVGSVAASKSAQV